MYSIFFRSKYFFLTPVVSEVAGGGCIVFACRHSLIDLFPLPTNIHLYTTVAICIHMMYTSFMNKLLSDAELRALLGKEE